MRRTTELGGRDWQLRGFLGVDAALGNAARATAGGDAGPGWIPASVPGSVLEDLRRAGEVPDPYVERNSLACEWVPERAWVYRRRLEAAPLAAGEQAWLRFDGLDHGGTVVLDGEVIGRHEGMFVPFEIEVGERLRGGGSHELAVVVDPAPDSEPQVGRTSRVRAHKARMTYGWDFCPRMIHQGLWQPVSLEVAGPIRIVDAWARPRLHLDLRRAEVEVRVTIDAADTHQVRLEAELSAPDGAASPGDVPSRGRPVAGTTIDADVPAGRSQIRLDLDVPDPALWWPNGDGEPAVHWLTVRACLGAETLEERSVPVGFREIELTPNDGARADARPWTWVINGKRTWIRGWNWVPIDALYGVPRPTRLRHLLRLAREANVNLLRVWGGGLIETEAFYAACDAAGLMVWQEFSQSSSGIESTPSDEPAFVERMRKEAEAIVPLRRNHPSLVAWCGGNELAGPDRPVDDRAPVLAALHDVVDRLDPDRVWLPTSPSGPRFANRLEVIEADPEGLHDVHGPWEHQGLREQTELYDRGTSLFNSEFGVEGMANRRTHEALIRRESRWPATKANPVYRHLGEWWNNEPLVQAAFGGRLTDLESLRRASQHLQADGLRYAVEANRRRAFRNSGSIPWQFNESFPNAWCTSAVDHRGDPKPAYFAVRRAYAPVVVAASFEGFAWAGREGFAATAWAWSDREALVNVPMRARLVDLDGTELAGVGRMVDLAPGPAAAVGHVELAGSLPPLVLLDLRLGDVAANRYLLAGGIDYGPLLDVPAAVVDVHVAAAPAADGGAWRIEVSHRNGPAALGLRVEDARPIDAPGWAEASDGWVDLLPGEVWTVHVRWADAPTGGRRLRLSGWNVADSVLEAAG